MQRYSSFPHDLALLGGHDKDSSRALSWDDFVAYWSSEAEPLPLQPRWSSHAKKLVWKKAWRVPGQWSTATWPDFQAVARGDKTHEEAVQTPLTVMHMALLDTFRDAPGAKEAFDFLLSCGLDSNIWPGHGGSVIATACSSAHLPSISLLFSHGHDFQASLAPDAPARPQFKGSCLLHRVGKKLAAQSQRKGASQKSARDALRTLQFLVEHMPDPMATNAQGQPALDMVLEAAPALTSDLMPIWLKRVQQQMAMQLGCDPELTPDLAQLAQQNRTWALKGKAQAAGEPLAFLASEGVPAEQGPPAPFSLSPLEPGPARPEALVLRADKIARSNEPLDGPAAQDLAREEGAEAVVCQVDGRQTWWAFHPRQVRPALLATPAPSARPRPPRL